MVSQNLQGIRGSYTTDLIELTGHREKLYKCSHRTNKAQGKVIQVTTKNYQGIRRSSTIVFTELTGTRRSYTSDLTELTGHREKLYGFSHRSNRAQEEVIHVFSQN